jgi:hypothetical protein
MAKKRGFLLLKLLWFFFALLIGASIKIETEDKIDMVF